MNTPALLSALLQQTEVSVLVTVAIAEGSLPREAGAKMLVTKDRQFDAIGGGHLEFKACEYARTLLSIPAGRRVNSKKIERFPLGPALGQCCGGVVFLTFERIEPAGHALFIYLQQRGQQGKNSYRLLQLDTDTPPSLYDQDRECIAGPSQPFFLLADETRACQVAHDAAGHECLIDFFRPYSSHLFLLGAGHVGTAIIRALADIPCHVHWVDEREELFPPPHFLPGNVTAEAIDTPEAIIDAAPATASFLVMTHSHTLDQRLAEHILRKSELRWFGLIGSRTKRIQFGRRLYARGISQERLENMVCPISIEGIEGKLPAVIAVAVVAQLLQVSERQSAMVSTPSRIVQGHGI